MDVLKLDINSPEWFACVEAYPYSNIFHHPLWAGFIADCYGYKPFVLAILGQSGQIDVGIPFLAINSWLTGRRWVSLPFSDHCSPISQNNSSLNALMEYLLSQCKRKSIPRIEIRSSIPLRESVYQNDSFVWHKIKLMNDPEELLCTFHKSRVQEKIRQAIERGVDIRWGATKADMQIFYNMMVCTHRRLGAPIQPKSFYNLLWDRLIKQNLGFMLLAYYGNEPIAGAIFLYYKDTLTAKYNASIPQYWKLKANNLLYWSAIKWGCENRFTLFDFGRTDAPNKNLRDFKNGWGTTETPLHYSVISTKPYSYMNGKLEDILHFVIKKSPLWICRLTGELLYKHFG